MKIRFTKWGDGTRTETDMSAHIVGGDIELSVEFDTGFYRGMDDGFMEGVDDQAGWSFWGHPADADRVKWSHNAGAPLEIMEKVEKIKTFLVNADQNWKTGREATIDD